MTTSWLDALSTALRIKFGGVELPQRQWLDFEGPGVTLVDVPEENKTLVTITGGGGGIDAPPPADGIDGINAFALTGDGVVAVQPAVDATVTVTASADTSFKWMAVGQIVFIQGAGYFRVSSVASDGTSAVLVNLGYLGNLPPGDPIPTVVPVVPGGLRGPAGTNGTNANITWASDLAGSSATDQHVTSLTPADGIVDVPTAVFAFGTTPSTVGYLRFPVGVLTVISRVAAGGGNLSALAFAASDAMILGDAAGGVMTLRGSKQSFAPAGTERAYVDATGAVLTSGSAVTFLGATTSSAATRGLNFPNNSGMITARNWQNSADVSILFFDGSNNLYIGDNNWVATSYLRGNTAVQVNLGNTGTCVWDKDGSGNRRQTLKAFRAIWDPAGAAAYSVTNSQPTATTTDATTTTLDSYVMSDARMVDVLATVTAYQPSTGDCYRIDITATYKRFAGGVATLVGAVATSNQRNDTAAATWTATIDTDAANTVRVRVTGQASKTINWSSQLSIQERT